MKRVHSRIRSEIPNSKLNIWDRITTQDMMNVREMIAIDSVQWIYQQKFRASLATNNI